MKIELNKQNYNQYHIIGSVNRKLAVILIDTGSCTSHIGIDLADEIYESENIEYTSYKGEEVVMNKVTKVEFIFSQRLVVQVELPVDLRKTQSEENSVLLGIDFLENFEFEITSNEIKLNGISIPRIKLYYKDIQEFLEK